MKKRFVTLLTIALSTTLLLCGCGNSADAGTTNNDSGNSSEGFLSKITNSNSTMLSERLSQGKIIAYKVESVDKANTPDEIFFFDEGKVSIMEGELFGLTMGDYAKMSDQEIWDLYEEVRPTYVEKYNADMESKKHQVEEFVVNTLWIKINGGEDVIIDYGEGCVVEYGLLQKAADLLEMAKGKTPREVYELGEDTGLIDSCLKFYAWNFVKFEEYNPPISDEEKNAFSILWGGVYSEDRNWIYTGRLYDDAIEFYKSAKLQAEEIMNETSWKGPFFDLPFALVVETDSSGNQVQSEALFYPTLRDSLARPSASSYNESINFAPGLTHTSEIYDTTYNCIAISPGGSFCTRETLEFDTLESKNILIDLSTEEKEALFEEEVMARYE